MVFELCYVGCCILFVNLYGVSAGVLYVFTLMICGLWYDMIFVVWCVSFCGMWVFVWCVWCCMVSELFYDEGC